MGKFYGEIGYVTRRETVPGKWKTFVTEKAYSGEFNRLSRSWKNSQKINSDISISAEINVIADPFFIDHLHEIRYVKLNGVPWEVSAIEPNYPKYTISIGGLYNGEVFRSEEAGASSETP